MASFVNAAKRSTSIGPLMAIIGGTVIIAGYWGGSLVPSRGQPAEKAFRPVSHPWHAAKEADATNKDRVARYKYIYRDQRTGQLREAPSAISTEEHPIVKLPESLYSKYPGERYEGDDN